MDRPAPDPTKLLHQWDAWARGEELPGRTMANLKTGETRRLLETGGEDVAEMLAAWMAWEKGRSLPAEVLATLQAGGFRDLLARDAAG